LRLLPRSWDRSDVLQFVAAFAATVTLALGYVTIINSSAPTAASLPPTTGGVPSSSPISIASPTAAAASPGPTPGASVSSGPPSTPSPEVPGVALDVDTIAETVTDRLRVRSQPRVADDSRKLEPLLPPGTRLFVVGGPIVATGYQWYLVRPLADPGLPLFGWVASADHDGSAWIGPAHPDCPPDPTVSQLGEMERHVALACYGRRELTLDAWFLGSRADCPVSWSTTPTWLDDCYAARTLVGDPGDDPLHGLEVHLDPEMEAALTLHVPTTVAVRAVVVGRFDDPAAGSCRLDPPIRDASSPPYELVVLACRATFVATRVELFTGAN
jgi:hypothetical protein